MRRRSAGRADWVYRSVKFQLDDPTVIENRYSGTYYIPINLAAGDENATAQVLYDSNDYVGSRFGQDADSVGNPIWAQVGSPARPDRQHGGALIHGVDVGVYCHAVPSAWVAGVTVFLGARIIVMKQDIATGLAFLPQFYSMWSNVGNTAAEEPAVWANGRENCWERRWFYSSGTSTNIRDNEIFFTSRARFKRRLNSNEALYLYLELHPGSFEFTNGSFINLWCRTLVSDDSAV